jgi:hypothetical protein
MDFCSGALAPTTPEMHERVGKRLDPSLVAGNGPLLPPHALSEATRDDEEAKDVLDRINSRKAINGMYNWAENFEGDNLNGFSVVLKRGSLGLERNPVN